MIAPTDVAGMSPTDRAREHIRGAIADIVLSDLHNNGDLVSTASAQHGTVDVLFQLSWALDAIEAQEASESHLRSA